MDAINKNIKHKLGVNCTLDYYGISGCGVFKAGIKINCIQMKLPNFENWSNGKLSKIGHHFSNKRL